MIDSRIVVEALCKHDPVFTSFVGDVMGVGSASDAWEALYGSQWISKMSPDPSALAVPGKKLVGALKPTGAKLAMPKPPVGVKAPPKPPMAPVAPTPKPAMAPTGMQRPAPRGPFGKSEVSTGPRMRPGRLAAGGLVAAAAFGGGVAAKDKIATKFRGYKYVTKPPEMAKSYSTEFDIVQKNDDKKQVFGWASVIEKDGQPVLDKQGDIISADEMEKSAYRFVIESRKGGQQHRRTDDDQPLHVSDMIESMAITPEKIAKMGLPDSTPIGWWVGFQIKDDNTWEDVKNGKVTSFSIHGRGRRVPVE